MTKGLILCFILLGVGVLNLSGCYHAAFVATDIIVDNTTSQEAANDRMRRSRGPGQVEIVDLRKRAGDKTVRVGAFESFDPGKKTFMCRLAAFISPPENMTYEEFFRAELIKQLKAEGVYSENAAVVLTGKLEDLGFSSYSDYWNVSLKVNSSNGKSVSLVDKYEYKTHFWSNEHTCTAAQREMPFAVRSFVDKLVRTWEFPSLFDQTAKNGDAK